MTTKIKILGQRNGITRGQNETGSPVFIQGVFSKLCAGETANFDDSECHGRLSSKYHRLQDKYYE